MKGFSKDWEPWQSYWRDPSLRNREACRASLTDEAIRFQYQHGAPADLVSPDGYTLDAYYMHRAEAQEIQLDLVLSYRTNVALYPAFQRYFREHRPPLLAVWGRNDPFFLPPGAEAYGARFTRCGDSLSRYRTFRVGDTPRGNRRADAGSSCGGRDLQRSCRWLTHERP